MPHSVTAWVLTDGKAGDEQQCLGVVEALGVTPEIRRVAPRPPFSWLMPWGPIDPREAPGRPGSPLAPPWPDLVVASGRRAVPYLRAIAAASGGRTMTVFLKDPRTGTSAADLIWVPAHDRLRGDNVLVTTTPPHRVSADRLARARATPDPRIAALASPRVGVLLGGDSRHHRFGEADVERLVGDLRRLTEEGAALMVTASRRTPTALREAVIELTLRNDGFFWNGDGENPYVAILAAADALVVTADSYNMVGEAAATGRPVLVFEPGGGHPKISAFLRSLERDGVVRPFRGRLERFSYEPLDSTPIIAAAIAERMVERRYRAVSRPSALENDAGLSS
jgi:mitochondrial fission protein ELM1